MASQEQRDRARGSSRKRKQAEPQEMMSFWAACRQLPVSVAVAVAVASLSSFSFPKTLEEKAPHVAIAPFDDAHTHTHMRVALKSL